MARRALKRGNGEGSLRERADGRWEGIYVIGYGADGRLKRKSVYGRTQAEAIAKLDALKQQIATGTHVEGRVRVEAYLEQWLQHKKRALKPTSAATYTSCLQHLKRRLGRHLLKKLEPRHIDDALGMIADDAGVPTANNCRRILYGALKQALRWRLVARNPVEVVDPLRHEAHDMTLWTASQAVRFLDHAREHRLFAAYYLALATGMRRGELLGLRWTDIAGDLVRVRQTRVRAGAQVVTSTPKTKTGERSIAIASDVSSVLEEHKRRQDAERVAARELWTDTGLVFTDEIGVGLGPSTLAKSFERLSEAAGVPRVRLHDLRHLHASMCIRNGMDPKTLAERLGHARASFTLDTYTHLYQDQRTAAPVSLTAYLMPQREDQAN